MRASVHRPKAWLGLATNAAMTIPCTADWVTMTALPSRRVASAMETRTTAEICHGPLPATWTKTSAVNTPTATPTATSKTRRSRWP